MLYVTLECLWTLWIKLMLNKVSVLDHKDAWVYNNMLQ